MKIKRKGLALYNKEFLTLTIFPNHGIGKNRDYVGLDNLVGVTVGDKKDVKMLKGFNNKEVEVSIEIKKVKK